MSISTFIHNLVGMNDTNRLEPTHNVILLSSGYMQCDGLWHPKQCIRSLCVQLWESTGDRRSFACFIVCGVCVIDGEQQDIRPAEQMSGDGSFYLCV